MNNWISVKNDLPAHEDVVLIINHFNMTKVAMASCYYTTKHKKKKVNHWYNRETGYIYGGTTTHWMPLPEIPKELIDMSLFFNKIADKMIKEVIQGEPV